MLRADPGARAIHAVEEHPLHARVLVSQLRLVLTRQGPHSRAAEIVAALQAVSPEFVAVREEHPVGWRYSEKNRMVHAHVGELRLHCQSLLDPEQTQTLLVFTATPGSESAEKLQLLSVIGTLPLSS